jgi:AraC family transcriptional regulator of adaptative response/methylated-DNA-[protein]-cysteine methyltransferase
MKQAALIPGENIMYEAVIQRDPSFEGIFLFALRTTGIFCRPTCPARHTRRETTEFFPQAGDALAASYRPCHRCHPMESNGKVPIWLKPIMRTIDDDPMRRWTGQDLTDAGVEPAQARRWFQAHHGMTFYGLPSVT